MAKKALITGGAGFIGSHLTRFLLKKGWEVTCLDNLSVGSINNLEESRKNARFSFIKADLFDEKILNKAIKHRDFIFHLGAVVGVDNIFKNPLETITTDFLGTEKVLRLSHKNKVKKVFFASSSEIYGTNTKMPLKETSERILGSTDNPRWSYAASKALAEQLCFAYRDKYSLPVTVGRFFNVYGPGCYNSVYRHVIVKFILQALKGNDLIIYGQGNQTRSFIYIDDAVSAIYKVCLKKGSGVYNVGNPKPVRIVDLAKRIIRLTGSKSKIVNVDPKQKLGTKFEDIVYRSPNVRKLKKAVNFRPEVSLDEGLKRTIGYLKII